MREFRTYGSVRGAHGNGRPYRDQWLLVSEAGRRSRHMTQDQKIIRAKVGLLELAKQPGNSLPLRRRGSAKPAK